MDDKVNHLRLPGGETVAPARPSTKRRRGWIVALLLALVAIGLVFWLRPFMHPAVRAGHGGHGGRFSHFAGAVAQPVAVAPVAKANIPIVLTGLGTVTPLATVTVRPEISGQLTRIGFKEGQEVKKGDFLAQIDDRSYRAALKQLQGQLAKDQALLADAKRTLARDLKLSKSAIAQQTIDTQRATVEANEGTVAADQAQIEAAEINISNCRIVSPIDGRVGLRQVDAGNYVTPGDSNGIVVITQMHPISVVFSLPESNLSAVLEQMRAGAALPVTLYGRDDRRKIATGALKTVDNQIDPTTGTVKMRAVFPNADETLFPNQFVNVYLLVRTLSDVTVAPNAAIQHGAPGTYVYVVNADDTVSVRKIGTGAADASVTQVVSGLKLGDKVVVDGVDRLKDGAKVTIPAAAKPAAQQPAAAAEKPGSHRRHNASAGDGRRGHATARKSDGG